MKEAAKMEGSLQKSKTEIKDEADIETVDNIREFLNAGSTLTDSETSQYHVLTDIMMLLEDDDLLECDENKSDNQVEIFDTNNEQGSSEQECIILNESTSGVPSNQDDDVTQIITQSSNEKFPTNCCGDDEELKQQQNSINTEKATQGVLDTEEKLCQSASFVKNDSNKADKNSTRNILDNDKEICQALPFVKKNKMNSNKASEVDALVKFLNLNPDTADLCKSRLVNKELVNSKAIPPSVQKKKQSIEPVSVLVPYCASDEESNSLDLTDDNVIDSISEDNEPLPPGVSPQEHSKRKTKRMSFPSKYPTPLISPNRSICRSNLKTIPLVELPKINQNLKEKSLGTKNIPFLEDTVEDIPDLEKHSKTISFLDDKPSSLFKEYSFTGSSDNIPFLEENEDSRSEIDNEDRSSSSCRRSPRNSSEREYFSSRHRYSSSGKKNSKEVKNDNSEGRSHSRYSGTANRYSRRSRSSERKESAYSRSASSPNRKRRRSGYSNSPDRQYNRYSRSPERKHSTRRKDHSAASDSESRHSGSREPCKSRKRSSSPRLQSPDSSDAKYRMERNNKRERSRSPERKNINRLSPDSSGVKSSQPGKQNPHKLLQLISTVQPLLLDNLTELNDKKREVNTKLEDLQTELQHLRVKHEKLLRSDQIDDKAIFEVSRMKVDLEIRARKLKEIAENLSVELSKQDELRRLILKSKLTVDNSAGDSEERVEEMEEDVVRKGSEVEQRKVKLSAENDDVLVINVEMEEGEIIETDESDGTQREDDEEILKLEHLLKVEERLCRLSFVKALKKCSNSKVLKSISVEKNTESVENTSKSSTENKNRESYCERSTEKKNTDATGKDHNIVSEITKVKSIQETVTISTDDDEERQLSMQRIDDKNAEKSCEKRKLASKTKSSRKHESEEERESDISIKEVEVLSTEKPAPEDPDEETSNDIAILTSTANKPGDEDVVVAGWTQEDMKQLKSEIQSDSFWGPMYRYKMKMCNANDKIILREHDAKPHYFKIFKDLLWKSYTYFSEEKSKEETIWRIVVPRSWSSKVLSFYHSDDAGHSDVSSMTTAVMQDFIWVDYKKDIQEFVENCNQCKIIDHKISKTEIIKDSPFKIIIMDIIGPLPKTRSGYEYVIGILDTFSRFVRLYPIRKANEETAVDSLEDYSLMYEYPRFAVTYDQSICGSETFQNFCKLNNISHISLKKPANLIEISEKVKNVVQESSSPKSRKGLKKWSLFIRKTERFINRSKNKSSGYVPLSIVMRIEEVANDVPSAVGAINIMNFGEVVDEWMDCLMNISQSLVKRWRASHICR